ncbi:cyclic peptide export ABC transporter [Alteromonas sp. ASW11-130]|uniref:cyclic peptide export ABC transporter n=1 Tax=Alteromonas sp. ASW11-130 TaxID=3015775 RepID=UPI00224251C0|nr:cyclic peptide export ABC transporter [Alteromonas sp. ASW11-130]MCW8090695.1 cyclic peptide export ABC transporter [Alteromonas sp. ASW11-130]
MSTLSTFSKKAPNRVFIAICLGALAGIFYSALIPLVLSSISPDYSGLESTNSVQSVWFFDVTDYKLAGLYLASCLFILVMRSASEIILIRVSSEVSKDIRKKFYDRIANAPLVDLERIGSAKLIGSINIDVPRIVAGGTVLPALLISSITLLGMLSFLMYLNMDVFQLVIMAIFIGAICYQIPMAIGGRIFHRSREAHDELQHSIRGLIYGAKELKLDAKKRALFFEKSLLDREEAILKHDKKANTVVRTTMSFGDLICFFVIGAVSFIFINYHSISKEELVGVIMALLYVTGPIAVMLATVPTIIIASISYKKLNELLDEIPNEGCNEHAVNIPKWNKLRFSHIEYQYPSNNDEAGFQVGPLNFEIRKGEVTFIIGGNGSGKSTMSKLLTMHYSPTEGDLYFGNTKVTSENIASCRNLIGAIYSDYHLFDELFMELSDEVTNTAERYLEMLQLSHKVKIKDGKFTTIDLSDGQKKRLALLVALLEEKELYLFDEWAADQDPEFKDVFYRKILSDMKKAGKAVVVISHDSAYFETADNILVMESGKLKQSRSIEGTAQVAKQEIELEGAKKRTLERQNNKECELSGDEQFV